MYSTLTLTFVCIAILYWKVCFYYLTNCVKTIVYVTMNNDNKPPSIIWFWKFSDGKLCHHLEWPYGSAHFSIITRHKAIDVFSLCAVNRQNQQIYQVAYMIALELQCQVVELSWLSEACEGEFRLISACKTKILSCADIKLGKYIEPRFINWCTNYQFTKCTVQFINSTNCSQSDIKLYRY